MITANGEEQLRIDECFSNETRFEASADGEAWQYKMRKEYAEKESTYPYWQNYDLSVSASVVREISIAEARVIIEKYEWLGCMPVCVRHCYGLFFPHKTDENNWLLGGVTVFSQEYTENRGVWDKYGYTGKIILLSRGVNIHFCPKNANSHLIMESIKLLPEKYKVVTCTIDPLAGEIGTIYQSCNFVYVGVMRKNKKRSGWLIDGKLYGSRSLYQRFGVRKREDVLKRFPQAKFIQQNAKGRYFYFRGDKRERRENYRAIQHLVKKYPKRTKQVTHMIEIYNEDCIQGMRKLEAESVDLICTDPPYRIISGGNATGKWKYSQMSGALSHESELTKKGKIFEHNDIKFREWLPEVYRVLKPNTHCYIMINPRNLKELWEEAERVGFIWQQLIVWDKGTNLPNKFYMNAYELILMLRKGRQRVINNAGCKNIITIPAAENRNHPTEKPVPLMRLLIENSTDKGEIVLDPFVGGGSTAVACQECERSFIGYEIDENYYRIAQDAINGRIRKYGEAEAQISISDL